MTEQATRNVTPDDAATIVNRETNMRYNPVVSTEEVAEELGLSPETAFDLLDNAPGPSSKPVGETHVWWW